jgi:hypothetical protein
MAKKNPYYDPISEDENFFRYQNYVDACCNYFQETTSIEKKRLFILVAYLARIVYETGYTDGLVAEVENKIYN